MKPVVCHVTTVPLTLWAFLRGHVEFQLAHGFDVHAVSSSGPLLDEFRKTTPVPVHAIEMVRGVSPIADLGARSALVRLFRSVTPSIVHAHTPKAGLLAMLAARSASVPVRIYHLHGLRFPTCTGVSRMVTRASERAACRLADRVLCVSESLRVEAVEQGLVRPQRIVVSGAGSIAGVDASGRFSPACFDVARRAAIRRENGIPDRAFVVGFVGRLVRDKGIVELANAWRALRDADPDLHLLLVGPQESGDPVPADVLAELGSDPRVHLAGEVLDPAPFFAVMDLFVLPSHREGFGVVLLEAAALEVPVVASRVTGCVDAVVDGTTGTLVPRGSAEALVDAVRRYRESPELCRRHGRAGRERVLRSFRPEEAFAHVLGEYESLLSGAGLASAGPDPR